MQVYRTKVKRLTGTDFHEVHGQAFTFYKQIKNVTKRRPYVRSAYFNKDKVFLPLFWQHLFDKTNWRDRVRRLKYFPAAIELIKNTKLEPKSIENPHKSGETLYRFSGATYDNYLFYVQIKKDRGTGQKYLISVFPKD